MHACKGNCSLNIVAVVVDFTNVIEKLMNVTQYFKSCSYVSRFVFLKHNNNIITTPSMWWNVKNQHLQSWMLENRTLIWRKQGKNVI